MGINKKRLGRTGYMVSQMSLGAYQFTGEFGILPEVADQILDYAIENGINYIDTAQMYGFGESEELVGRALKRHPDKEVIVSTKVGYLHERTVTRNLGMEAYKNPVAIKRAIKHSMWLLRKDFIDIMMIHEPNENTWWGFDYKTGDSVVLDVLEDLKKEGVIGAIGLGCWVPDVIADLIETSRIDVILNAGGINLLGRPMFDRVIPAAKKHDVGVVVGGGMGSGGWIPGLVSKNRELAHKLQDSDKPQDQALGVKLEKLYNIADELDCTMFELAIRYIMSFDEIHAHVPGAREVAHIKENIASACKGPLDPKYVEMIKNL